MDKERKVGTLGNIKTDERGNGYLAVEDAFIQLHGENTYDMKLYFQDSRSISGSEGKRG